MNIDLSIADPSNTKCSLDETSKNDSSKKPLPWSFRIFLGSYLLV